MILGLQNFAIGYNKLVKKFAEGLSRCSSNFEKDMFNVMRSQDYLGKRGEASELEFSTLSIAITGVRSGIDTLARVMEDAAQDIVGDMIEPLETYHKHYNEDSQDSIAKSIVIWNSYEDSLKKQKDAKDKFYGLKEQAMEQEKAIEKAMVEHENGTLTTDKVQKISKRGVTVKYKAEVASQTYKKAIEGVNNQVKLLHNDYCPNLQKLQQLEESRINFMKYNLEKMMKHICSFGLKTSNQSKVIQEQTQFISSETDIKLFVNENRSEMEVPKEVNLEALNLNEDFEQH